MSAKLSLCVLVLSVILARADDGLVAFYNFDEGSGTTLRDRSGGKSDAAIHGARFVPNGDGYALRFDGADDCVDCGSPAALNFTNQITVELWMFPEATPAAGEAGIVAKDFASYGFTYGSGGQCWWYISGGGNNCRATVATGGWHHVVGTFDGATLRLYVDGRLAASQTSKVPRIAEGKNLYMAKSAGEARYTKNAHFKGMLDEVRIYGRALSPEEIARHYRTTNLTRRIGLKPHVYAFSGEILVELDLRGLGDLPPGTTAEVSVWRLGGAKPLLARRVKLPADVKLDASDLPAGDYELRAIARDRNGKPISKPSAQSLSWPTKPSWAGGTVLNCLVTELLNLKPACREAQATFCFTNPRDGWVFVRSTAGASGDGRASLFLDADKNVAIVHERGQPATLEAMRWLPSGRHELRVVCGGRASVGHVIVRAIPELAYTRLDAQPHVTEHGPYDWAFVQKYLAANLNVMVSKGAESEWPHLEQWKRDGKKWLVECGVPGLREGESVTADETEKYWTSNRGLQEPLLDGVLVDEFWAFDGPKYAAWTEAVRRIRDNPKFAGKAFYPYCGSMHSCADSRKFIETVMGAGWPFAFERYQTERPTEAVARGFLDTVLREEALGWRRRMPGSEKHMIVCLGILSAPHESQNVHPTANFKTYLDMQFHLIANDPVFYGVRGLMTYLSSYADEEIIRWVSRLYRHYGIEGRTERLSKDPYALTHIANPDFDDGTRGWTIAPAEDGSIATKSFNGLSWLQGRYPRTSQGDNFLWMKRSAKRPNVVSQPIKDLRPGRLYSLKMMSADYRDLVEGKSAKQKHAVSITLDGVELSRAKCFQHVFANNYAHHLGPFNRDHKFWMNYHRLVFRAKGKTARFSISDWATGRDPGGPVGQELALNFLEVQPYLGD